MRRGLVAVLIAPALSVLPAYGVEPAGDLTVHGRGYGHGRGMSQYGAQGAALAGLSAARILDFYYPGTTTRRVTGLVRIHITADTTASLKVATVSGLRVRDLSAGAAWALPAGMTMWQIDAYGNHQTRLSGYHAPSKRWVAGRIFRGMAQFEGAVAIPLVMPSGAKRWYRGALRTADRAGANLDTLNVLTLEQYLRGVVPREALLTWRPAALQAQAVAARTYAVYHRDRSSRRDYDLCDTTACQVYGGQAVEEGSTDRAIAATAGLIRTHRGSPIIAEFSSSNGGFTASGPLPYQTAKADPYDGYRGNGNRNSAWVVKVRRSRVEAAFGVGRLRRIEVIARNGHGAWGGRALTVRVTGSSGRKTFTGDQVRFKLGLRSAWFAVG